MKVLSKNQNEINVLSMKDGDIGIITSWNGRQNYLNRVVQRSGKDETKI